jgi:hypothetical protein
MELTQEERPEPNTTLPVRPHGEARVNGADAATEARPAQPRSPFVPYVPSASVLAEDSVEPEGGPGDLSAPRPGADLASRQPAARWTVMVFAVTLLVYLTFVPRILRFSSPPTGDQAFYLMVTISIVQDLDLDLANNYAQRDEDKFYKLAPHPDDFVGISAPYPLPPHNAYTPARPPGEWYNFHWPGLSLALVPAWVIGGWFGLWWPATVVFMCIVGALVAANVFLLAYEMTGKTWIALAVWVPLAFSSPLMTYTYLIFTELPTGLLLIYSFRRLAHGWKSNGPLRLVLVGLSIGFIPWVAWRCILIAAGLFGYAIVQWWRGRERVPLRASAELAAEPGTRAVVEVPTSSPEIRRHLLSTLWLLVPVAISAALMAWHNLYLFGALFANDRSPERGAAGQFIWPWLGREGLTHFASSIYGLLFDRLFGLVTYAPLYVLAVVGIIAMVQSRRGGDRRLVLALLAVAGPYLFMIYSFYYWNGLWGPPARFLVTFAPLAAAPLALTLYMARGWLYRAMYALLALPGIALMAVFMLDPRFLWPGNPVFGWLAGNFGVEEIPPLPFRIDLWDALPAVDPLDERRMPVNTAWMTLAAVAIIAVGYLLVRRRQREWAARSWPAAAHVLVWLGALSSLGGLWYFANYEHIQPATVLTPVQSWHIPVEMKVPRGITLHDGKMYIADYEGPTVGELDLATGDYRLIEARGPDGPVPWVHPGDVQFGPDGLLYVVNNGMGNEALYGMTLQGEVKKRIALEGKGDISVGLRFKPDGGIVIADMRRALVFVYGPDGGPPLVESAGEGQKGLNNVTGIELDAGGNMYAFEMSGFRVQVLAPDGRFLRDYKLKCQPMFGAIRGGWLDVTCERGLTSVNLATGRAQSSRMLDAAISMPSMLGATYGPDGTLFVIHDGALNAYRVEH